MEFQHKILLMLSTSLIALASLILLVDLNLFILQSAQGSWQKNVIHLSDFSPSLEETVFNNSFPQHWAGCSCLACLKVAATTTSTHQQK